MKQGKVILVGAGPGDGGLLTLKGKAALDAADVVIYDALVGQEVLGMMPERALKINVGKRAGNHPVPQNRINELLLEYAQEGKLVVRLKGGDPFLFGRGGEELELLAEHGIPFEVVPGVTSAIAVPAYGGIPVTHREFASSLHIITGHTKGEGEDPTDYQALARLKGTLVFLMGVSALDSITAGLIGAGMSPHTPAAILEQGTTASQRKVVADLGSLPEQAKEAHIKAPAVIVVGQVCQLSPRFAWAEKRPLGGCRVLVTRPRDRASQLAKALRAQGAEVALLPAIRTQEIQPNPLLRQTLEQLNQYQWLVFTSPAGVEAFFSQLRSLGWDIRRLVGMKLAAIGSATAARLEERGLVVDLVPESYNGAALGEALAQKAKGERLLLLRAREGSQDLPEKLKTHNLLYTDLPVYDTIEESADPLMLERLRENQFDWVAFTSASTVRGFAKAMGQTSFPNLRALCIGHSTAKEAEKYGMKTWTSPKATIQSMVETLINLQKEDD